MLIVNYGGGVDSTAILIRFAQERIIPDLIIFADVGEAEKPETYAYVDLFSNWLEANGLPRITCVKRYGTGSAGRPIVRKQATTTYDTLEGACEQNSTMPSLAFGFKMHSCSINWKAAAIHGFLKQDAQFRAAQASWEEVRHVIGFDAGKSDCSRRNKADAQSYSCLEHNCKRWYPLQDWGWERTDCVKAIAEVGLPVPVKSACFFCPASRPWEVAWLISEHPGLFRRAVTMEDRFRNGKHGPDAQIAKGKKGEAVGLWFDRSWRGWAKEMGFLTETNAVNEQGEPQYVLDRDAAKAYAQQEMPAETAGTEQLVQLSVGRLTA